MFYNTRKQVLAIIVKIIIIITGKFASITINNRSDKCTAWSAVEFDREIEIEISKRAFTWDVIFHPTGAFSIQKSINTPSPDYRAGTTTRHNN